MKLLYADLSLAEIRELKQSLSAAATGIGALLAEWEHEERRRKKR